MAVVDEGNWSMLIATPLEAMGNRADRRSPGDSAYNHAMSFTAQVITLALLTAFFTAGIKAEPKGISRDEIDKQQQQLNKDRWQFIRSSLDLQKRAEQELRRQKGALREHITSAIGQALAETSPVLKAQSLFEDRGIRAAFFDALHGDFKSWFTTIGRRSAEEIADILSQEAPAWADPGILTRVMSVGSQLLSMNSEAKQLEGLAEALLRRQATIDDLRTKLIASQTGVETRQAPKNWSALDRTVTQLDRWLDLGDRAFDKAGGHDQDAENQFYSAFPELAACGKCRRAAITGSPATEVDESLKASLSKGLAGGVQDIKGANSMSPDRLVTIDKSQLEGQLKALYDRLSRLKEQSDSNLTAWVACQGSCSGNTDCLFSCNSKHSPIADDVSKQNRDLLKQVNAINARLSKMH